MRKFAHWQDLQINKKNYFEEGAFNGASSFFVCKCVFRCPDSYIIKRERGKVIKKGTGHFPHP